MSVGADERRRSVLEDVSTALVRLHKEQFGRGPTRARTYFAGPDAMVCILYDALLPAERRLVEMGETHRVTDTRTSFQAATRLEFTSAIEEILHRKVTAFASAVDPEDNVVFENYVFAPVADTDESAAVFPDEATVLDAPAPASIPLDAPASIPLDAPASTPLDGTG